MRRSDGRVRRRITAYVPPELAIAVAVRCVSTGVDISDFVADAVQAYLDRA